MSLESAMERLAAAIEKMNDRAEALKAEYAKAVAAATVATGPNPPFTEAVAAAPKATKPKAAPKTVEPKAEEAPPVLSEIQQRAIAMVARADLGRAALVKILEPYNVKKISELADNAAALRAVGNAIQHQLDKEVVEV